MAEIGPRRNEMEHVYPVTEREQTWIDRLKCAVAGGSLLFIAWMVEWYYDFGQWIEEHVEGYVPLINLATEG
jgi:hypothetical protein